MSRRAMCGLATLLLVLGACGVGPRQEIRIAWDPVVSLNAALPEGIRVYSGADPSIPLRAWYVRVRPGGGVEAGVLAASTDEDGVETASEIAARTSARVVVNGGYFRMDRDPATPIGLLKVNDRLLEPALTSVLRGDRRYYLARAALGFTDGGAPDIAWVSSHEGMLYEWLEPPHNAPDAPVGALGFEGLEHWEVRHAVAGGPVLVMDGKIRITVDEEVFFGTTIPDVHPRTAAGVTAAGELIALVVDGRQRDSRGVDLQELATLMHDLGCVEAMNLDGGGSSTMVVDGTLVNRPAGGQSERPIASALAVVAR